MPTFFGQFQHRQIIFTVGVSVYSNTRQTSSSRFRALLDTGAQCTQISQRVVDEVGLASTGSRTIVGIEGNPFNTPGYLITLDLPVVRSRIRADGQTQREEVSMQQDLRVAALPSLPPSYDVLLGMDFIGDLHLTIHHGQYIISN